MSHRLGQCGAARRVAVLGLAAAAALLACGLTRAQTVSPAPTRGQIIIRILEAHSGKPIYNEPLGVWLEKGITFVKSPTVAPTFLTNKQGDAVIPLHGGADVDDLSLWVLHDIPCEPFNKIDGKLDYPIKEILNHGVVSDNVCGKAHHVAVPGVLIVFVKHHPWWQIP